MLGSMSLHTMPLHTHKGIQLHVYKVMRLIKMWSIIEKVRFPQVAVAFVLFG